MELDYRVAIAFIIIIFLVAFIILTIIILDANSQTSKMNNNTSLLSNPIQGEELKEQCLNNAQCKEVTYVDKFGQSNSLWKLDPNDTNAIYISKYDWEFTQKYSLQQKGTIKIEKGRIYKIDFIPQKVFGTFKRGIYSAHEMTNKNIALILSPKNSKNVYQHSQEIDVPWKTLDQVWVLYE